MPTNITHHIHEIALNTRILDPAGRPARLITRPIPGRGLKLVTILYDDGRARLVDLDQCRTVDVQQRSNPS
jgi:hypothetical protein